MGVSNWPGLASLNMSPGLLREVERQLDRWDEAMRSGDAATAQTIFLQLHTKGIDPEKARQGPICSSGGFLQAPSMPILLQPSMTSSTSSSVVRSATLFDCTGSATMEQAYPELVGQCDPVLQSMTQSVTSGTTAVDVASQLAAITAHD